MVKNGVDAVSELLVALFLVRKVFGAFAGVVDYLRDLGLVDAVLAGFEEGGAEEGVVEGGGGSIAVVGFCHG